MFRIPFSGTLILNVPDVGFGYNWMLNSSAVPWSLFLISGLLEVTDTVLVVEAAPQPLLTVYVIVATPGVPPVITPELEPIDAIEPSELVHAPPVTASPRVIVAAVI